MPYEGHVVNAVGSSLHRREWANVPVASYRLRPPAPTLNESFMRGAPGAKSATHRYDLF